MLWEAARHPSMDPQLATKCHRGGKSTWPDRDTNPGSLSNCALSYSVLSYPADLWQLQVNIKKTLYKISKGAAILTAKDVLVMGCPSIKAYS